MGLKAFTRSPQRPTNPAYKKVFKYKLPLFFWLLQGALNVLQTQHIKKFLNINFPIALWAYYMYMKTITRKQLLD